LRSGVRFGFDQTVILGVLVQKPHRGDEIGFCAAPTSAVRPNNSTQPVASRESLDLHRCERIERSMTPNCFDDRPIPAVMTSPFWFLDPYPLNVLADRGHSRSVGLRGGQVVEGQPE
jgi:hypothetical protein